MGHWEGGGEGEGAQTEGYNADGLEDADVNSPEW